MNANYQRFSIIVSAITLLIFFIALTVHFIRSPSTDISIEQPNHSTSHSSISPDASTFAPFKAPNHPTQPTDPQYKSQSNLPDTPNPPAILPKTTQIAQNPTPASSDTKLSAQPAQQQNPTQDPEKAPPFPPENARWMAQISPEQEAKIDAILDAAEQRNRETMTNNQDRRTAIETVNLITQPCFEELYNRAPDIIGHIIVNFEIIGNNNGRGYFENVNIQTNYKLNDMTFENCIVTLIQSAMFESQGTDRIWVEHGLQTPELSHD